MSIISALSCGVKLNWLTSAVSISCASFGGDQAQHLAHPLGAHARHAQNAKAAGLRHFHDDIAAMGEREDRHVDTEHLTHRVFHDFRSPVVEAVSFL